MLVNPSTSTFAAKVFCQCLGLPLAAVIQRKNSGVIKSTLLLSFAPSEKSLDPVIR